MLDPGQQGDLGANEPVIVDIHVERSLNPDDFSISWPSSRTKSYASQARTEYWPSPGNTVYSEDFADVVQEWVNLSGHGLGSKLCVLLWGRNQSPNDTRKQIRSHEYGSDQPNLNLVWGAPSGMSMAFHPVFVPRRPLDLENVDCVIRLEDIPGDFTLTPSTEKLHNSVRASFGEDPVQYTELAEDQGSIRRFDRRAYRVAAGADATEEQAEALRDAYLELHANPIWRAQNATLRTLRDRGGNPIHPACMRAGSIAMLTDFQKWDPEDFHAFYITETAYNDEQKTVSLGLEIPEVSLPALLAEE